MKRIALAWAYECISQAWQSVYPAVSQAGTIGLLVTILYTVYAQPAWTDTLLVFIVTTLGFKSIGETVLAVCPAANLAGIPRGVLILLLSLFWTRAHLRAFLSYWLPAAGLIVAPLLLYIWTGTPGVYCAAVAAVGAIYLSKLAHTVTLQPLHNSLAYWTELDRLAPASHFRCPNQLTSTSRIGG